MLNKYLKYVNFQLLTPEISIVWCPSSNMQITVQLMRIITYYQKYWVSINEAQINYLKCSFVSIGPSTMEDNKNKKKGKRITNIYNKL